MCVCALVTRRFSATYTRDSDIEGWGISPRGAGYLFGNDVVAEVRLADLAGTA